MAESSKKNTGRLVVVQCRFGSSRLPGKALYPLAGLPMVAFLLRRLKQGLPGDGFGLVLATSRGPEDDAVAAWGREEGAAVFRGEADDVLARFLGCLAEHPAEIVVRVTADNPLTCPRLLAWAVARAEEEGADYLFPRNLPRGAAVDVFSADALRRLGREARQSEEREHINKYILDNPERFKVVRPEVAGRQARPELSLTVDTIEDWRLIRSIFRPQDAEPWRMELEETVDRLDRLAVR